MLIRNAASLEPSLHSGVIAMAKPASDWANAPAKADDVLIGLHADRVRYKRTLVNVETVRRLRETVTMDNNTTIGSRLREMVQRTGLSYDAVALRAGYRARSSVQEYFNPEYNPPFLSLKVAKKLAKAFEGTNVSRDEVLALSGVPDASDDYKPVSIRSSNEAVLTSTFAVLLSSLGIDHYEDERARKLAARFRRTAKKRARRRAPPWASGIAARTAMASLCWKPSRHSARSGPHAPIHARSSIWNAAKPWRLSPTRSSGRHSPTP